MLLIQFKFLLLVALCWITFFTVPRRFRSHVLAFYGAVFYATYAPAGVWLIGGLVVGTYLLKGPRGMWLAMGLIVGFLAYFKAPGEWVMAAGSPVITEPAGAVLMPIGFSYLALELIHFSVERNRGRILNASIFDLAAFALFLPCRVAGPIKRYPDFTAAVGGAELTPENFQRGCLRILAGLGKKVGADLVGRTLVGAGAALTPLQGWQMMLGYSIQLYLDFSAYSDIAIGVSRLMGITVPENFRYPYLSSNIQEFWARWHMSLSSWAHDYVFSSLGRALFKTRLRATPGIIAAVSYITTFLVIGAWHGLTPNFLAWGAYHGILLSAFHVYRTSIPVRLAASPVYQSRPVAWMGSIVTFLLVTIGWVFFRMDLPSGLHLLRLMFNV